MDLFKALTGKNPAEYELAAKELVNKPDIELFKKLVNHDDFLFDFVKSNVAKRIEQACNKDNYQNIFKFFDYYSPYYDGMFADVITKYGGPAILLKIKDFYINGNNSQKAYALKYFTLLCEEKLIKDVIPQIRTDANSEDVLLANNAIEVLSTINDEVSQKNAIDLLESDDEFEQYNAVKFLVTFGATDLLPKIIDVMKKSSFAENIAAEILYLTDLDSLLQHNFEDGILVLCNIINAIPEIIPPSNTIDYSLFEILNNLYHNNLTSASALLLRMAKDKFESLVENEEYLYDCDKNTKDEVRRINVLLQNINVNKLNSFIYEELYEESYFVFFALDYVNEVEELVTLLDSSNQTLLLKVLSLLKEKAVLNDNHKQTAMQHITSDSIRQIVEAL